MSANKRRFSRAKLTWLRLTYFAPASMSRPFHSMRLSAICGAFDYHVSVHCFDDPETFFVYPIRLEDRLPPVAIPLLPGDSPVTVDLQSVFDRCYDAGPYAREIRLWCGCRDSRSAPIRRPGPRRSLGPGRMADERAIPRPHLSLFARFHPPLVGTRLSRMFLDGYLAAFLYCSRRSFTPGSS